MVSEATEYKIVVNAIEEWIQMNQFIHVKQYFVFSALNYAVMILQRVLNAMSIRIILIWTYWVKRSFDIQ